MVQPSSLFWDEPSMFKPPLAKIVAPWKVPPAHVNNPLTVKPPGPAIVPPLKVKAPTVEAASNDNDPLEKSIVSVPPLARLWTASLLARACVIVIPGMLMTASSEGPGTLPAAQFVSVFQSP